LPKGAYILFSIINSLNTSSYISLILLIITTLTFYLIKGKINKPGRIVIGCEIIPMIMLIVTRLLEEYRPYDTLLCKISLIATFVSGGIFFIVLIVMAYIAKKSVKATLLSVPCALKIAMTGEMIYETQKGYIYFTYHFFD